MAKRGRLNLGLASIVIALLGAATLGACSDDDNTGGGAGSGGQGGASGSAGKGGSGGSAGKAGATGGGGSAGKAGATGSGGATAGGGGASGGRGGEAGTAEGGAAGSIEGGAGGDDNEGGAGGAGPTLPCGPGILTKPANVPAAIAVKDTAVLVAAYAAVGVQTYTCTATTVNTTTTYAWSTASVPTANLYGTTCTLAGMHYAGPHWKSTDGSIILGTKLRAADSTSASSIPQLLLTSTVDAGTAGILTPVVAVQRLNTVGGIAPTTACGVANVNGTADIPYTATYYFYSGVDIIPAAP